MIKRKNIKKIASMVLINTTLFTTINGGMPVNATKSATPDGYEEILDLDTTIKPCKLNYPDIFKNNDPVYDDNRMDWILDHEDIKNDMLYLINSAYDKDNLDLLVNQIKITLNNAPLWFIDYCTNNINFLKACIEKLKIKDNKRMMKKELDKYDGKPDNTGDIILITFLSVSLLVYLASGYCYTHYVI